MPQALGSIIPALSGGGSTSNWMKLLLGGTAGAGEIGNILADRQRADLLNKEKAWMALTPQQLSAKIAAGTQPLSQGLTQSVGNVVQAEMGERGLAQAPGIYSSALAQALAPYYQQNQNTALQAILAQMGLPIQSASLVPGAVNMGPMMQLLLQSFQKPTPTPQPSSQPSGTFDFSNLDLAGVTP